MATFKAEIGKQVFFGGSVFEFKSETYETTDEKEIKVLEGAIGVKNVTKKETEAEKKARLAAEAEAKAAEEKAKKEADDAEEMAKLEAEEAAKLQADSQENKGNQ